MTTKQHFSTFELDVYFASRDRTRGAEDPSPIAAHVATCATCAAYLAELAALEAEAAPAPHASPASLAAPASPAAPHARVVHLGGLRRLAASVATVAALAAAVLVYVKTRPAVVDDADYVGAKGTPAVQILVRSSGQTRVWDGRSAVRPGDSLAVHVACEQLEHVTVGAPSPRGVTRLSDGACPKAPATLPFTLVVDGEPGSERLIVVIARRRLDDGVLADAVRAGSRSADVWVTSFEFPKESR
jgi:hypothetical protein